MIPRPAVERLPSSKALKTCSMILPSPEARAWGAGEGLLGPSPACWAEGCTGRCSGSGIVFQLRLLTAVWLLRKVPVPEVISLNEHSWWTATRASPKTSLRANVCLHSFSPSLCISSPSAVPSLASPRPSPWERCDHRSPVWTACCLLQPRLRVRSSSPEQSRTLPQNRDKSRLRSTVPRIKMWERFYTGIITWGEKKGVLLQDKSWQIRKSR